MNWDAIIAISEIIGAAAIVITLVYLTIQLRQNTKALRSSSWQAVQDAEQRFDEFLAQDKHLAEIWVRGWEHGLDSFEDPAEKFRFSLAGKQLVDLFQTHHYQYEKGMIEVEWWETWVNQFKEEIERSSGFRELLRERQSHLRPSFRQFVDELIKDTENKK